MSPERNLLQHMRSKQGILIFKSIVLSILLVFFMSCGKKEVKKVSEESLMAQEAFKLAETIKQAYLDNDRKVIERNAAHGFVDHEHWFVFFDIHLFFSSY